MANIAIFRINYKSDFILTLNSDAGWLTPFCIKFWTGAPSQAYFVGFDGTTYTHCAPVDGEPTKLLVQFDGHHLPIGDLKFQIGYHFTVADFPTSIEDEVINQSAVIIDNDGEQQQVMLDFNGETAPEIEFSLPAYANEAQRIANESQRIANEEQRIATETQRIANEEQRISQEQTRQQNEVQRIVQEQARVTAERERFNDYAKLKADAIAATNAANSAADLANEKAQLAADNAQLAADKAALAQSASALATEKAQLATDKAALAQSAATLANEKAALAQQKAEYATAQGDYAKAQGDYAKAQAGVIPTDVTRTQTDAMFVNGNHDPLFYLRKANSSLAGLMTAAGYTKLNDMPAAQEVNAGLAYDVSVLHPTSGVNGGSTYASLSAALAVIPQDKRKGGMTVKFVQSSDNNYVQWRLVSTTFSTDPNDWVAENEDFRNEVMQEVNEAIASINPIEITGDVTNAPDEHDLTSVNIDGTDVLRFKNKDYAPLIYSGMGRTYLRKNIVNGVNVMTQDMFYKGEVGSRVPNTNTIFLIQYDYDLNGQTITIPEGCVLKFDGGSLRNGTINWNNTLVEGNVNLKDITIGSGKLSNDTVYVDWFSPYGDGEHDDSNTLVQAVKSIKQVGVTLVFGDNKTYLHGDGLDEVNGTGQQYNSLETYNTSTWQPSGKYSPDLGWFNVYNNHFGTSETPSSVDLGRDIRLMFEEMSNITIEGNGSSIVSNENNGITKNNSILWLYKCNNVVVRNLKIDGKKNERFGRLNKLYSDYNSGRGYVEWHNIRVVGCSSITFENVTNNNSCHNAFDVKYDYSDGTINYNITFINCYVDNAYKNGIGSNSCIGITVRGGKYGNNGSVVGIKPKANIDLEPESTKTINNVLITNAEFYWDLDKDLDVEGEVIINDRTDNSIIESCDFVNCGPSLIAGASSAVVRNCKLKNSVCWGLGGNVENCKFVYDENYITFNGDDVNHQYTTPIIMGGGTSFINNKVIWSENLASFTGYFSFYGNVYNNVFTNTCGSGSYIIRIECKKFDGNIITDAGVDGKPTILISTTDYTSSSDNVLNGDIRVVSGNKSINQGIDYLSKAKPYITRTLLLGSDEKAILFYNKSSYASFNLKIGLAEKVNNTTYETYLYYNQSTLTNKRSYFNLNTTNNYSTNIQIKHNSNYVLIDLSNVVFSSSRYVWVSIDYDYIFPYQYNFTPLTILTTSQLTELYNSTSFSPEYQYRVSGTTGNRPINALLKPSSSYFDTTLNKDIYWNGEAWVDGNGFTATTTRGHTTDRPKGSGASGGKLDAIRDVGFQFFDIDEGKPIYASAIANDGTVTWVDATGETV